MILIDFIFALIIALFIASILSALFGGRGMRQAGTWPIFFFLFLILLPMIWAGGVWVAPFGSTIWGGYWLPFVIVGIFVALLLAALLLPDRRPRGLKSVSEPTRAVETTALAVGSFFWLLVIALTAAIIAYYV